MCIFYIIVTIGIKIASLDYAVGDLENLVEVDHEYELWSIFKHCVQFVIERVAVEIGNLLARRIIGRARKNLSSTGFKRLLECIGKTAAKCVVSRSQPRCVRGWIWFARSTRSFADKKFL